MKVTKSEMAQTIIKVLYNMKNMPSLTDGRVEIQAKHKRQDLVEGYEHALSILFNRGEISKKDMEWKVLLSK